MLSGRYFTVRIQKPIIPNQETTTEPSEDKDTSLDTHDPKIPPNKAETPEINLK